MHRPRLLCCVVLICSGLTASPGWQSAAAQPPSVCDCADVFDLINRLNMAQAAVSALESQIPLIEAADKQAGKTSKMDDTNAAGESNYTILKNTINAAVAEVQMLGGQTSQGETDGMCDSSVVSSSTACMDEIVRWHEDQVHVPACDKDRAAGKTTLIGFRAPAATLDYAREEIAGYESEIARIREVLRSLPASCRPAGWVGMIYYFDKRTMESQQALTPGGNLVSGTEGTSNTLAIEARVLYRETGTPTINVRIGEKNSYFSVKTARWGCTGGLRQGPLQETVEKFQEDTEISGTGEEDVEVYFSLDETTGEYALSFQVPGVNAQGDVTRTDEVQGGCNPADDGVKKTSPGPFSTRYEGVPVSVSGKATRGLDTLKGEETINAAPVSIPDLSLSHVVTVRWAFHRIR